MPKLPSLPTEDDVHCAAVWRLAEWRTEAVAAGQAQLAQLMVTGQPLDAAAPAMAAVLKRLEAMQPAGERRTAWTAACALLALLGEARGDMWLFALAGQAVLEAHRQAVRGAKERRQDALDQLIEEHLLNHPDRTAPELFKHFQRPELRAVIADATNDEIGYDVAGGIVRYVSRRAFAVRVSRARQRLRQVPAAAMPPQQNAMVDAIRSVGCRIS